MPLWVKCIAFFEVFVVVYDLLVVRIYGSVWVDEHPIQACADDFPWWFILFGYMHLARLVLLIPLAAWIIFALIS